MRAAPPGFFWIDNTTPSRFFFNGAYESVTSKLAQTTQPRTTKSTSNDFRCQEKWQLLTQQTQSVPTPPCPCLRQAIKKEDQKPARTDGQCPIVTGTPGQRTGGISFTYPDSEPSSYWTWDQSPRRWTASIPALALLRACFQRDTATCCDPRPATVKLSTTDNRFPRRSSCKGLRSRFLPGTSGPPILLHLCKSMLLCWANTLTW